MEKREIKWTPPTKRTSFWNKRNFLTDPCDDNTKIRLGISMADEQVKEESEKRKANAPLTTEEEILSSTSKL